MAIDTKSIRARYGATLFTLGDGGFSIKGLCDEIDRLKAAVEAEREACAKVAEQCRTPCLEEDGTTSYSFAFPRDCAAAIRSRATLAEKGDRE